MRKGLGIAVITLLAAVGAWVWLDYQAWLSLGPGGLPSNFGGWLTTTRRSVLEGRNGLDTSRYDPVIASGKECAFLGGALPKRSGARPKVGHWPVPHRQLDQFASADMKTRDEALFTDMAAHDTASLMMKKSIFEKHNDALFTRQPGGEGVMTEGEAGHIHPSDGSVHVIVGAADAAAIIEFGWGQAHPLAGRDKRPIGYLMVYAPRDAAELDVARRILGAAIGHVSAAPCAVIR